MDKAPKPLLLFVDDSKVMRLAADKMLGGEFRVEVAENGLQAWTMITNNPSISVVFSDLAMPEMDGFALLKKIRTSEDEGIAGLPVIIVTGAENDEEARAEALRLGGTILSASRLIPRICWPGPEPMPITRTSARNWPSRQ